MKFNGGKNMKITKIANIAGGQDGAVHGGFLFRFDEKSKCHVYETKKLLCAEGNKVDEISSFDLDKVDILMPHNNAVMFGNYFSPDDEFPLLYTNLYNSYANCDDKMKGTCAVYRLTRHGDKFETKLVQIIEVGFTEDTSLWASAGGDVRPYGNFVLDPKNNVYYGFTMRDGEKKSRYFAFDLPKVTDGKFDEKFGVNRVVLEKEDIKEYFDCDYHRYVQGAIYHEGNIYSLEGFTNDTTNVPAMRIIDTAKKIQKELVLFGDYGMTIEPEFIDFCDGICYYSDNFGNLYTIEF